MYKFRDIFSKFEVRKMKWHGFWSWRTIIWWGDRVTLYLIFRLTKPEIISRVQWESGAFTDTFHGYVFWRRISLGLFSIQYARNATYEEMYREHPWLKRG